MCEDEGTRGSSLWQWDEGSRWVVPVVPVGVQ